MKNSLMAKLINRAISVFTLLFALFIVVAARGAENNYRRSVSFEWDPIEGAETYELVIKPTGPIGPELKFNPNSNNWSGQLPPGHYEMRTRSLDRRRVPGDWAAPVTFDVNLEKMILVSPKAHFVLNAKEVQKTHMSFSWQALGGVLEYEIEIKSLDGQVSIQQKTKATTVKVDLPVAKKYSWKVRGIGPADLVSEAESNFSIFGGALQAPAITVPINEFVRELSWSAPAFAQDYEVGVFRFSEVKKKWEKVRIERNWKNSSIVFDSSWMGGFYQLSVIAHGEMRKPSPDAVSKFRVRYGDRSASAEYAVEIKKSIDRINGWYGVASYLITVIDYKSTNLDPGNQATTKFNALGGTGRLGLGYFLQERPWGFLGIADLSGFLDNQNRNMTYASVEMNGIWRHETGLRSEFRAQIGAFYKDLPVAVANPITLAVDSYSNIAVLGTHLGMEYWYSLSPKLGLQINAHVYQSLLALSTPNGQANQPMLTTQFGFLGSYRLTRKSTGLMGYARRSDQARYTSTDPAKTNEVSISGNYLNFFLEYGF
jgi:hypothetical protein